MTWTDDFIDILVNMRVVARPLSNEDIAWINNIVHKYTNLWYRTERKNTLNDFLNSHINDMIAELEANAPPPSESDLELFANELTNFLRTHTDDESKIIVVVNKWKKKYISNVGAIPFIERHKKEILNDLDQASDNNMFMILLILGGAWLLRVATS